MGGSDGARVDGGGDFSRPRTLIKGRLSVINARWATEVAPQVTPAGR